MIHIPSDLIVAHDPEKRGTLLGDKIHSAVFDNSMITLYVSNLVCVVKWAEGLRRTPAWFEARPEAKPLDHAMKAKWDRITSAFERALP